MLERPRHVRFQRPRARDCPISIYPISIVKTTASSREEHKSEVPTCNPEGSKTGCSTTAASQYLRPQHRLPSAALVRALVAQKILALFGLRLCRLAIPHSVDRVPARGANRAVHDRELLYCRARHVRDPLAIQCHGRGCKPGGQTHMFSHEFPERRRGRRRRARRRGAKYHTCT